LKRIILSRLADLGVEIRTDEKALNINKTGKYLRLQTDKNTYESKYVINSTYSSINTLNRSSGLEIIPLKHEVTEMCLVKIPPELEGKAFTVMCGPFFSLMPFPAKGDMYTLSHVRYTPHSEWHDKADVRDGHQYLEKIGRTSHFPQMYADIKRYMPVAGKINYSGESLWEVKTTLSSSERDDSRPIMYRAHHGGLENYICIMGGKLDNIYDVFREVRETYAKAN
jgi:glycine/D-amino acid oxidase-like deaminating enzyme